VQAYLPLEAVGRDASVAGREVETAGNRLGLDAAVARADLASPSGECFQSTRSMPRGPKRLSRAKASTGVFAARASTWPSRKTPAVQ
jgi:hypothetical protein